ncbi:DUF4384 domain-containing protein [Loktanella sp. M215]|uniref:DUF4384 domain-containing protein n=1 Tax=Loktanella sp. M215 TaxID=2675431 RepID=UPI001F35C9EB|nr:DUF4384 domain-containing protein [Loktanella sp. M215]MCF7699884.1 hypothetical protein [Loktanella sp. M215]
MIGPRTLAAVAGSLALHGAAMSGLAMVLSPRSIPDQTPPQTRIEMISQAVRQTEGRPAETGGEAAAEGEATVTTAIQGRVLQTRPRAEAPIVPQARIVATPLATVARLPTPDAIVAARPSPVPAPVVALPSPTVAPAPSTATPVASTVPTALRVAAAVPTRPVQRATLAKSRSAAALPPQGATLAAATAPATAVTPGPPAATKTMPSDLPSEAATDLPLPATARIASLAWSGGDTAPLTAQSLAAIAAFSTEGDASADASKVRDGIAGLLSAVPCARLQTVFDPATGTLSLSGHIPEDALRGPVLSALRAQMGTAIAVADNLKILPRPQCGALAGIADAGLPQSDEQLTNPRVIGANGFARDYTYTDGQPLQLDLAGPDYDSFVYVDYFAADGSVIHLQPNTTVPLEPLAAKAAMTVGRPRNGKPYLTLTVGPPYGQEIAAAFATSVPLYDGMRPVTEPAAPYLSFLKDRIAAARRAHSDFKGEWVYFFVTTQPD